MNNVKNIIITYFIKSEITTTLKVESHLFLQNINKFIFINRKNFLKLGLISLKKKKIKENKAFFFLGFRFLDSIYLKQLFYSMFGLNPKYYVRLILCLFGCFFNIRLNLIDINMLYPCQLKLKNTFLNYDLQKKIKLMIDRLINLQLYHGYRHGIKLTVRGQRTKTNSQTQKKKRYGKKK